VAAEKAEKAEEAGMVASTRWSRSTVHIRRSELGSPSHCENKRNNQRCVRSCDVCGRGNGSRHSFGVLRCVTTYSNLLS
jgi:hypothetical protein